MPNYRSPWFPFVAGGALLVASLMVFKFSDQQLFAWLLLGAALPLIFEGEAWRQASNSASFFYDFDSEIVFEEAYNPKAALPRYLLLYIWVYSIIILREANVLPTEGWIVIAIIFLPMLAFLTHAIAIYRKAIRKLAAEKNLKSKFAKTR